MVEELMIVRQGHRKERRELGARYEGRYKEIQDSLREKVERGDVGVEEIVLAIMFRHSNADVDKVRGKVRMLDDFLRQDLYVYGFRRGETEVPISSGGFVDSIVGTKFVPIYDIYFGKQNGLTVNNSLDVIVDFDGEWFNRRIEGLSLLYEHVLRNDVDLLFRPCILEIWEILNGEVKDGVYSAFNTGFSKGVGFTDLKIYVGDIAINEMRKIKKLRNGYTVDFSGCNGDRIMKILRNQLSVEEEVL